MERWLIIGLILFYFYTISCGFLAVRVAALKGRRRAWGWLGVLLGLLGVIIVCFLPNKKGVEGQTNPVISLFQKLSRISPAAVWLTITGVFVIVGGIILGSYLTDYLGNRPPEDALDLKEDEIAVLAPETVYGEISAVFCGENAQFALTDQGDLYGWGNLDMDPLEESGLIYKKAKKICSVGDTIYLLASDGTLYAKGDNTNGLILGKTEKKVDEFIKIADKVREMDLSLTCGAIIKTDGKLYVFGKNTYGQLGSDQAEILQISHCLAESVVEVQVTDRSVYYRLKNGEVYGVGSNAYGQFGLGDKEARATPTLLAKGCLDLAAGDDFLLLLKKDGSVVSAGNNAEGQLGRQTAEEQAGLEKELAEQAAKEEPEDREDKEDKKEQKEEEKTPAVSQTKFGKVELPDAPSRLGAGDHSAYALIGEELYGWGRNQFGQVGEGGIAIFEPQLVYETAAEFAAGGDSLLVISQGGKLLGIGDLRYYQLGNASGEGLQEIAEVEEAK